MLVNINLDTLLSILLLLLLLLLLSLLLGLADFSLICFVLKQNVSSSLQRLVEFNLTYKD